MAIFQQQPIVTDHPFVALQNHSQHVPPYQFQRAGGGAPPPLKSIPVQLKSIPWGGGGSLLILSLFSGGGGGWRALSFDISILSRGQINFEPTPIFVNKNSSFALPELAFVIRERERERERDLQHACLHILPQFCSEKSKRSCAPRAWVPRHVYFWF